MWRTYDSHSIYRRQSGHQTKCTFTSTNAFPMPAAKSISERVNTAVEDMLSGEIWNAGINQIHPSVA